jgi:S1-C subfamily serine protease
MSVRVTCPACRASYSVGDEIRGKTIRCRECDQPLPIPARRTDADTTIRLPDDDAQPNDAIYDTKGRSAPRPTGRGRREEETTREAPRKARSGGLIAVLLVVGGSFAVLAVLGIALVVLTIVIFRGGAPEEQLAVKGPGAVKLQEGGNAGNPVLFAGPGNVPPPDQIDPETLAKVKQATVYLRVTMPNGQAAEGSGFFAVEPGVVITNAHVLGMLQAQSRPPANVDVVVHSGEPGKELVLRGQVAGVDRATDLAVVRVPTNGLPAPLPVDSAHNLQELQKVYLFGFPFGKKLGSNITITAGDVSSLRKDPSGVITQVQLNGDMQPGNSGGPVVDSAGRVVGVAVAIIKGTRINFAVPADFVRLILAGRLAESNYGEVFVENDQRKLPVKFQCLDPLDRIKSMRVEVWAGSQGPTRAPANQQPPALPGDGPRQVVAINYQNHTGSGDVPLPDLQPGQVYWVRPVFVSAAGGSLWLPAAPLESSASPPLQRLPVNIQMKTGQAAQRTIKLKNSMRMNLYQGNQKETDALHLEADILETLTPKAEGTSVVLTIGGNAVAEETKGKLVAFEPKLSQMLRQLTPSFLLDGTGKLRQRGDQQLAPNLAPNDRQDLELMYGLVCNAFEACSLYVPNRAVNPLESWPTQVPMLVGSKDKKKVVDLHLTCVYEGCRVQNNRTEAMLGLTGIIRGREKDDTFGKVTGRAQFDVEAGYFFQVHVAFTSELDFAGGAVQMVLSHDINLTRIPGNPLNITPVAKGPPNPNNDPPPRPDGAPPR